MKPTKKTKTLIQFPLANYSYIVLDEDKFFKMGTVNVVEAIEWTKKHLTKFDVELTIYHVIGTFTRAAKKVRTKKKAAR